MRIFLLAALIAGCYSPSYRDCQLSCATSGECPAGFHCDGVACRGPNMSAPCTTMDDALPDTASGLTIDTFQRAQIEAICDHNVRCGTYDDLATCISILTVQFGRGTGFRDVIEAVHQNKASFDPAVAQACLDSFATRSCDRDTVTGNRGIDLSCLTILSGTVGASGACGLDAECISQSCVKSNCPAGTCCQGTCAGSAPPGMRALLASCTSHDICIGGYCSVNQPAGTCQPYKGDTASCARNEECRAGASCRMVNGAAPTCAPLADPGQICTMNADCKDLSNVCASGSCRPGGLTSFPCGGSNAGGCQNYHLCTGGKCVLFPGQGESCATILVCRDGICSNPNQICTPYKPDGDSCALGGVGAECQSLYCNAGVCQMQPSCI